MATSSRRGVPTGRHQYRLERIQVYNWGTFSAGHDLAVPRGGLLLTGHSGSGKSSLLDALATVLVAPKDVRYNVAAQDSTASDRSRTVLSYVRGAYKRTADETTGELRTAFLRTGATFSGIALTFARAEPADVVTLVRLFHVRAGAVSSNEVRHANLLINGAAELTELMPYARQGIDRRRLKRDLGESATISESYQAFATRFRRRLGLGNEVAQRLLHKTQSAKNLTSLDVLLRDFMLDEPRTFADADAAVEQFGELRDAHLSVVETRQQQEALLPLRDAEETISRAQEEQERASALLGSIGPFVAAFKETAYRDRAETAERRIASLEDEVDAAGRAERAAAEEEDLARRECAGLGDGELALVEERLATASADLARIEHAAGRLAADLAVLDGAAPSARSELAELQAAAASELEEIVSRTEAATEEGAELHAERRELTARMEDLRARAEQARRSRSAMGRELLLARETIAESVGVSPATLPFVGEVLELVEGAEHWRVAAEAVAGGFARTMLVPDHLYLQVVRAVDAHRLRARLTYERILPAQPSPARTAADALARKLRARQGTPVAAWLDAELTHRFTHHCVEDADALAGVSKGVTAAGQVKGSDTSHRKDDRRDLAEPGNWSIGVDPADRIAQLVEQHRRAGAELGKVEQRLGDLARQARDRQQRREACLRVGEIAWENVDTASARERAGQLERTHERLTAARPDLARAQERLRDAETARRAARTRLDTLHGDLGGARKDLEEARRRLAALDEERETRTDEPSDAVALVELERRARSGRRHLDVESIDAVMRGVGDAITTERNAATRRQAAAEGNARAVMTTFNERWSAYAAGMQAELAYLPDYLRALDALQADDLPRHERRFAQLLQSQSSQNVAQLAAEIRGAVREVRDRISPVNEALREVEYAPGHHLWIEVAERRPTPVEDFLATLTRIATGSLGVLEESIDEAEARFALLDELMTRLGSSDPANRAWRQACLDTRRHVAFRAVEKDARGLPVDYYEGASGLSGGQRQKLVVFCLAAALRYQLATDGEPVPVYALVVLDEAFDKTDAEFTRAGLSVFRDFGFQLLLATPMTKIQILEDYVGGAAVVTNSENGDDSEVRTLVYEGADREVAEPEERASTPESNATDGASGEAPRDASGGVDLFTGLLPDGEGR